MSAAGKQSDLALYRRLLREARPFWLHVRLQLEQGRLVSAKHAGPKAHATVTSAA